MTTNSYKDAFVGDWTEYMAAGLQNAINGSPALQALLNKLVTDYDDGRIEIGVRGAGTVTHTKNGNPVIIIDPSMLPGNGNLADPDWYVFATTLAHELGHAVMPHGRDSYVSASNPDAAVEIGANDEGVALLQEYLVAKELGVSMHSSLGDRGILTMQQKLDLVADLYGGTDTDAFQGKAIAEWAEWTKSITPSDARHLTYEQSIKAQWAWARFSWRLNYANNGLLDSDKLHLNWLDVMPDQFQVVSNGDGTWTITATNLRLLNEDGSDAGTESFIGRVTDKGDDKSRKLEVTDETYSKETTGLLDTDGDGVKDRREVRSVVTHNKSTTTTITEEDLHGHLMDRTIRYPNGSEHKEHYEYDEQGRIAKMVLSEPDGSRVENVFKDGHLESHFTDDGHGNTEMQTYDTHDVLIRHELHRADGSGELKTYDANGVLITDGTESADGSGGYYVSHADTGITQTFTFDKRGHVTSIETTGLDSASGSLLSLADHQSFTYYENGNLKTYSAQDDHGNRLGNYSYTWEYSESGKRTYGTGTRYEYTYDFKDIRPVFFAYDYASSYGASSHASIADAMTGLGDADRNFYAFTDIWYPYNADLLSEIKRSGYYVDFVSLDQLPGREAWNAVPGVNDANGNFDTYAQLANDRFYLLVQTGFSFDHPGQVFAGSINGDEFNSAYSGSYIALPKYFKMYQDGKVATPVYATVPAHYTFVKLANGGGWATVDASFSYIIGNEYTKADGTLVRDSTDPATGVHEHYELAANGSSSDTQTSEDGTRNITNVLADGSTEQYVVHPDGTGTYLKTGSGGNLVESDTITAVGYTGIRYNPDSSYVTYGKDTTADPAYVERHFTASDALTSTLIIDAAGTKTKETFDSATGHLLNMLQLATDGASERDSYTYGDDGTYQRLHTTLTAAGARTQVEYGYSAAGQLTDQVVTNPDSSVVRYAYDMQGRLASIDHHNADGSMAHAAYSYLPDGSYIQQGTSTSALGEVTATEYDYNTAGQLVGQSAVNPDGSTAKYAFNDEGQVISVDQHNADGSASHSDYHYSADGSHDLRVVSESSLGAVTATEYNYSTAGQLISQAGTNPDGSTVEYAFDAEGRVSSVDQRNADGSVGHSAYSYGASRSYSLQVTDTSAAGLVTRTAYEYASGGGLVGKQIANPDGSVVNYEFNSEEQEIAFNQTNADGSTLDGVYVYHLHGAYTLTQTAHSASGDVSEVSYDYNGSQQLIGQEVNNSDGSSVAYEFDTSGRISRIDHRSADGATALEVYSYHEDGSYRLEVSSASAEGAASSVEYEYDSAQHLVAQAVVNADGSTANYQFNAGGQVSRIDRHNVDGSVGQDNYAYNVDGSYSLLVGNTSVAGETTVIEYNYDASRHLVRELVTNPDGSTTDYQFNANDQIARIDQSNADGSSVHSTYAYNADGSYGLLVDYVSDAGDLARIEYGYDTGQQLVEELVTNSDGSTAGYQFNASGNITGAEFHNADGSSVFDDYFYKQDGSYLLKTRTVAADGTTVGGEYGYDAQGNLVSSRVLNDLNTFTHVIYTNQGGLRNITEDVQGNRIEDTWATGYAPSSVYGHWTGSDMYYADGSGQGVFSSDDSFSGSEFIGTVDIAVDGTAIATAVDELGDTITIRMDGDGNWLSDVVSMRDGSTFTDTYGVGGTLKHEYQSEDGSYELEQFDDMGRLIEWEYYSANAREVGSFDGVSSVDTTTTTLLDGGYTVETWLASIDAFDRFNMVSNLLKTYDQSGRLLAEEFESFVDFIETDKTYFADGSHQEVYMDHKSHTVTVDFDAQGNQTRELISIDGVGTATVLGNGVGNALFTANNGEAAGIRLNIDHTKSLTYTHADGSTTETAYAAGYLDWTVLSTTNTSADGNSKVTKTNVSPVNFTGENAVFNSILFNYKEVDIFKNRDGSGTVDRIEYDVTWAPIGYGSMQGVYTKTSEQWQYADGSVKSETIGGDGTVTDSWAYAGGGSRRMVTKPDGSYVSSWAEKDGAWGFEDYDARTHEEHRVDYYGPRDWVAVDSIHFSDGASLEMMARPEEWSGGIDYPTLQYVAAGRRISVLTDTGFGLDPFKGVKVNFSNTWIPDANTPRVASIERDGSDLGGTMLIDDVFQPYAAASNEVDIVYSQSHPDVNGYLVYDGTEGWWKYHGGRGVGWFSGNLTNPIEPRDNVGSSGTNSSGLTVISGFASFNSVNNADGTVSVYSNTSGQESFVGSYTPGTPGNQF